MSKAPGVFGSRGRPGLGVGILLVAVVAVLLLTDAADDGDDDGGGGGSLGEPRAGSTASATVLRVIDGDTVEVRLGGAVEDVRYIGVDTPESVAPGRPVECFGEAAGELNRDLVEGEVVRLVFDEELRDRYGRLLAYVHAGPLFVNAELVRRGYARTLEIEPNTARADLFARLEQRAGRAGRGLWGSCPA